MHAAAACTILLSLHLHPGSHVTEHAAYDDRIAWVLPPDRLAAFARAGVVITEKKKTRIGPDAIVAYPRPRHNEFGKRHRIDSTHDRRRRRRIDRGRRQGFRPHRRLGVQFT